MQQDGRTYVPLHILIGGGSHEPHMPPPFDDLVASLPASVQATWQPMGDSRSHKKKPLSHSRPGTEVAREEAQTCEILSWVRRDC